jgi:2-amino-4-hydroxy-6-hydroxymethyldihydropteridine diphosphokinase
MPTAYIALGSNLGDRPGNIAFGLRRLAALGRVTASPLTVEADDEAGLGPPYLNTAARLETGIDDPRRLLEECLRIELECGRARPAPPNSPRTLDLDLAAVEGLRGEWEWGAPADLLCLGPRLALALPHPRAGARGFVAGPLAAIAPDIGRWLADGGRPPPRGVPCA